MDYLFFCTGECEDALRDRDFYLVRHCPDEAYARTTLARYFQDNNYMDDAEYYSVFVKGDSLQDGLMGTLHSCYKVTEL